jgi:amino acid permease
LLNVGLGIIAVIAIDYLGNVVSLLGSLVGMPIALVYPPIMHNVLVKDAPPTTRYMNYFVSGIGIFAAIAASYATLVNWNEGGE